MSARLKSSPWWLLAAALAVAAGTFVVIALLRLGYPYELEWIEGGILQHIARIRAGQPLYAAPTLEYIPFVYPPLYYAVASLLGAGFAGPRILSLVCTLISAGLIGHFAHRSSGSRWAGAASAALFLAMFRATGAWYDLARVDMMMVALVLGGATLIRWSPRAGWQALGGALIGLSFFAKQSGLICGGPLVLWAFFTYRGAARWASGLALTTLFVGGCLALQASTDGWFGFYVLELPAQHELDWTFLARMWTADLLPEVPIALALCGALFGLRWAGQSEGDRFFLPLLTVFALAASWLGRLHSGGYDNVVIPGYAMIALCFGPALVAVKTRWPKWAPVFALLAVVQVGLLAYHPADQVPTRADRAAGDALVDILSAAKGEIYMPAIGYLAARVGRQSHAHLMAVGDIIRAKGDLADALQLQLTQAFDTKRWEVVVITTSWLQAVAGDGYQPAGRPVRDKSAFFPVTGARVRPELVLVPAR